ncbi:MAG: hypothetical protein AAFZ17_00785 [Cyanobacteria bacterium J06650_10]
MMQSNINELPDLDAIARNLIALDLAHLSPEESAQYEHELSVLAALNEALEASTTALKTADPPEFWRQLYPRLSDVAALVSSQTAPLLDLNAERSFELSERQVSRPLALSTPGSSC